MKAKSTEQEVDAFSFEILIGSRFLDYSHRVEILRLASTEEQLQAKALSQLKHPAVFLFRSHVSVHWQSHEAYICVPACILPIFPLLPPCLLGGCSAPITGRLFMRYPYGPWPPPIWPPKGNDALATEEQCTCCCNSHLAQEGFLEAQDQQR